MARKMLVLAYPIAWVLSVAVFWMFAGGSDGMGFGLVFIWGLNPLAIALVSFLMGRVRSWGARVWAAPVVLGLLYMMLPWATFSLANTVSTGNVHAPDVGMALLGAFISLLAVLAGRMSSRAKR